MGYPPEEQAANDVENAVRSIHVVTTVVSLTLALGCPSKAPSEEVMPVDPVPSRIRPSDDTRVIPIAPIAYSLLPVADPSRLDEDGLLIAEDWPTSIAEAVDWNLAHLADVDKERLKKTLRRDLADLDHGWGRYLRANFGMVAGNRRLMEACGMVMPDLCAMKIIVATWERLQKPALFSPNLGGKALVGPRRSDEF